MGYDLDRKFNFKNNVFEYLNNTLFFLKLHAFV